MKDRDVGNSTYIALKHSQLGNLTLKSVKLDFRLLSLNAFPSLNSMRLRVLKCRVRPIYWHRHPAKWQWTKATCTDTDTNTTTATDTNTDSKLGIGKCVDCHVICRLAFIYLRPILFTQQNMIGFPYFPPSYPRFAPSTVKRKRRILLIAHISQRLALYMFGYIGDNRDWERDQTRDHSFSSVELSALISFVCCCQVCVGPKNF